MSHPIRRLQLQRVSAVDAALTRVRTAVGASAWDETRRSAARQRALTALRQREGG